MENLTRILLFAVLLVIPFGHVQVQSQGLPCSTSTDWKDIYLLPTNGNAATGINITLRSDKTSVKPGENVVISFQADKDCYLTLMNQGTSGKILRLWPNYLTKGNNLVRAGEIRTFPSMSDQFDYEVSGPSGMERVVAYATTKTGSLLSENEFESVSGSFNQFRGGVSDLDKLFRERADQFGDSFNWGTAQLNLCVSESTDGGTTYSGQKPPMVGQGSGISTPGGPGGLVLTPTHPSDPSSITSGTKPTSDNKPPASSIPPPTGPGTTTQPGQQYSSATQPSIAPSFPGGGISGLSPSFDAAPSSGVPKEAVYLLGIGAPTGQLMYCNKDASDFTEMMRTKLNAPTANVKMVLGKDATYDGFVRGMQWVAERAKPEDYVLIYYSGHGTSVPDTSGDEEDGYDEAFVLYHTGELPDWKTSLSQKKLMLDDDFNKYMKMIPARRKILVADSCHSGTINKDMSNHLIPKFVQLVNKQEQEILLMGRKPVSPNYGNDHEALIGACQDNQSSYEDSNRKAGLFTYHLLKAVKEGAVNLEAAFKIAKDVTYKETCTPKGGEKLAQTPNLTDPHGFVKLFKFTR